MGTCWHIIAGRVLMLTSSLSGKMNSTVKVLILSLAALLGISLSNPLTNVRKIPPKEFGRINLEEMATSNDTIPDLIQMLTRDPKCCGENKRSTGECWGANTDNSGSAGCCGAEEHATCCGTTSNANLNSDRATREAGGTKSCCGLESKEPYYYGTIKFDSQERDYSCGCGSAEIIARPPTAMLKRESSCCGFSEGQKSEVTPAPESLSKGKREACCGVQDERA